MNKEVKLRQKHIRRVIKDLKYESTIEDSMGFFWEYSIDIYNDTNQLVGFLYPIGFPYSHNERTNKMVPLLAKWRSENIHAFLNQDKISIKTTSNWLDVYVYNNEDKILFMIYTLEMEPIGHIGLAAFDYEKNECEIDNVVRGEKSYPGMMTFSTNAIIFWVKKVLNINNINLRVLKNNEHAVEFYKKNNFIYDGEDENFNKMKLVEK